MFVDIDTIKLYIRIDDNIEDSLLMLMYEKALADINDSIDFEISETNTLLMNNEKALSKIKLLILLMIGNMYENRELVTEKSIKKYTYPVQSTLFQLKYCYSELSKVEEV